MQLLLFIFINFDEGVFKIVTIANLVQFLQKLTITCNKIVLLKFLTNSRLNK